MFSGNSWEAKFNEVKDWASSPSSSAGGTTPTKKLPSSPRDVGTASKARRPGQNRIVADEQSLVQPQPSCTDFAAWAFLSRDIFLSEEAGTDGQGYGVSLRQANSEPDSNTVATAKSRSTSNLTSRISVGRSSSSSSAGGLLHRRTASSRGSKGPINRPSIIVETPRTEPKPVDTIATTGINAPPPTPEGTTSVRSQSSMDSPPFGRIGSLLSKNSRTRSYLTSPINEDAPTEFAIRGTSPSSASTKITQPRSKKYQTSRNREVILDTTIDLDDSFSSTDSSTGGKGDGKDAYIDDELTSPTAAPTTEDGNKHNEGERKRLLNTLQSLRWFSAMHIICYHFLADTGIPRWDNYASWGASQLTYFFMLSGFILAYQYSDRGTGNRGKFLYKRWARLYPTYLLSIVVQCIALPRIGIPIDAGALITVIFSLTTWIPRYFLNHINTPGWSVGAFLFQYLLFPTLLVPIARAKQATRFKKLMPACWIYSILEAGHAMGIDISLFKPFNWIMLPPHTASFMFGIALGCAFIYSEKQATTRIPSFIRHFGLSTILVAQTILFVFVSAKSVPSILYYWTSHGLFMPLFGLIIWLGALETDCLIRHWFALKPFLLLGQVSFTVYILQGCAYTYSIYWIGPFINRQFSVNLNSTYVFLIVVNVVGFLVHFIFEQPAYNALLFLDSRNDRDRSFDNPDGMSGSRKKKVSGFRRTLNTFVSYECVRIIAYYFLMVISVGGYVALSISTSYIDWTGLFSIENAFIAELSVNILKCCFFLASPALLFGFVGHLIWCPARRVKVPALEESVAANDLKARLFFRIVTRGKNPDLVLDNVVKATNALRKTCLPEWQWKVEVATDNPLRLHELNDPQVHELLTPADYVCPNGGKYKARALHHAVMISTAREDDWVIHLDEESSFDQETVKYIYAHCAKEEMAVLRGEKRWGNIGQGVIKYGCHDHPPNYLTTLADSIRVADDFGKFRVQYEVHEPLIGMHGSFVVCQTAVEAAVGFDHGISGSITEDAYFALVARAEGVKFSWIDAFMYEQSPFNILDFIRQRSRWFGGLVLVCLASAIPLKQRVVLCFMTLSWAVVPLVTLASVTNYLIGTSWSASTPAYTIATSVLAGISCWGYVLGFFWTFSPKQGWIRYCLLFYAQLILQPVFAIMEMSGVIHGIINPPSKGFYIVQKQADGNNSNLPTNDANAAPSNAETV